MSKKRHSNDTATFEELTYLGQTRSINAQIIRLEASIHAHLRRAKEENRPVEEKRGICKEQLQRLLDRI